MIFDVHGIMEQLYFQMRIKLYRYYMNLVSKTLLQVDNVNALEEIMTTVIVYILHLKNCICFVIILIITNFVIIILYNVYDNLLK